MSIFNWNKKETKEDFIEKPIEPESNSDSRFENYGMNYPIITKKFDGEKTPGELGVIIDSVPDYQRLRLRAYDAEIKTDLVKIITSKFFKWVIGSGLKLQAEPNKTFLALEGVEENWQELQKNIEARFSVYSKSNYADFSRMNNLHYKAMETYKTAFLGGDCLVVCRVEDLNLNVQVIDGQHVKQPDINDVEKAKERGNHVKHGIEFNERGEHIAYYVYTISKDFGLGDFERIAVYGEKSKRKLAWMVYGEKNRVDHVRGIPAITQILEKLNKLDRYTEASVSKAEQGANVVYSIEHDVFSSGENPIDKKLDQKLKFSGAVQDGYALADGLANRIVETTSNQVFNMPNGAKLKTFTGTTDNNYEAFSKSVFNSLCASVDIPPEVALQMYNSNYSASRAAINSWGYIIGIHRENASNDFYKPVYKLWLEVEILKNKINLPSYISALNKKDNMLIEAYSQCRFIGKNMPHIDPLKEIKAIREMLGTEGATPLISHEQAAEMANVGDFSENYSKYLEEDKTIVKPKTEDNVNN
jgi:capsid protein